MKKPKPLLFTQLLLLQISLSAQVQWYQNQDGHNQFPNGTSAISVQAFTSSSFITSYLWTTINDDYTWKISKTNINGSEEKTFFVTGSTAQVEIKAVRNNAIYVLKKNYPIGQNPQYSVYKLDGNLMVNAQRIITFPNGFQIINMNAFETDNAGNVYLAGDGQYPNGQGPGFASFVLKADKNLVTKWSLMDSSQTSFTRIHVDRSGNVIVLADFYTYFPDVHLLRINANGQNVRRFTIETDPGRYTLSSSLDNNDNLLIYGSKSAGDTLQAMYLYKFSKNLEHTFYRKTLFSAAGFQLNDFKIDNDGNIFSLVAQFQASGELFYKISRINSNSGNISWNYSIPFSRDSCDLQKLVISANERFYAIGHQLSNNYYCKGFALRIKKNGNPAGKIQAPDSITFQRLHWLSEGILDQNNHLIAIGGTTDLDTTTFNSSYLKAFAVCFSNNSSGEGERSGAEVLAQSAKTTEPASEIIPLTNKLVLYPHPVTEQMTVAGLNKDEYDRLMIYNMQGALLLQQTITGTIARIDANALPDGVYLLVLHSSVTLKEKNVKFLVRR